MKPSIPETAWVLRTEGETATVSLRKSHSCRGCGAGAMGLCNPSGNLDEMLAKNPLGAVPGEEVRLTLDPSVRRRAFLLAFVIPLSAFIAGSIVGNAANNHLRIPFLDVVTAFVSLVIAYAFALRQLRRLDSTSAMVIRRLVPDSLAMKDPKSDEELYFEAGDIKHELD